MEIQGKEAGVRFVSTGYGYQRQFPGCEKREKREKLARGRREKGEAGREGDRVQARLPHRYPRSGESGKRGQGIPPERGHWDLRGCRGGGRAESGEV